MDPWLLEAKAHLYTLLQQVFYFLFLNLFEIKLNNLYILIIQYDKALESYLEIEPNEAIKQFESENDENDEYGTRKNFQYVFDLIEKQVNIILYHYFMLFIKIYTFQNLFDIVKDKILRLVKLSPKVAENLLVRNIDKIPVAFVVKQLKEETELLHL